ncbi:MULTISPECIES: recombination mediator RecR [Fusobacterium]|jgi:recombination protein RecR|uniref:Recombination protein RecR n=1 Tax=Fusobacterium varium ATCC 27725 TaxID=469618 RepID=A0ABM6U4P9_FUSVA|nr:MULTISPECIES: recombination mediator RecR [Fusobacterium]AVQ31309.1 recombination protein RecR [Fusobacterium varium ATCC 27725]EES62631.1 recombination protein RecR [Fusobacterium varium ATCC 27725]MCD7979358.1 recombination mediator RecR [Fusobacterium sp.]MCF0170103.1 recombination protein RecR [Fusobacterium varium]MCF2672544.1 recombination protein RecR [Fusobacterium varium]
MATKSLERLIDEFNKLPGIGRKSATRLAFHILEMSEEQVEKFSEAMKEVKKTIKKCPVCGDFCENDLCNICADETRDKEIVCVVEDSRDIISFEKTGKYNGTYHVLNGKIAPLNGMTPDKLNIKSLLERVAATDISEVILALNPDLEGETTSLYLTKLLKPFGVKITKIASGIPIGGNIEFADTATISKALDGRHEV